ncbi:MAG: Flp family type IVb pilin [Alphaproteobacteria bacterium]|nr:Flp family type IVb pilin [Alphaproteobacteria bacterium]
MKAVSGRIGSFLADEGGGPGIEYPLIAAAIAMVIIGAMGVMGGGLNGLFGGMSDAANASLVNAGGVLN